MGYTRRRLTAKRHGSGTPAFHRRAQLADTIATGRRWRAP
jgi:hypothetical protein